MQHCEGAGARRGWLGWVSAFVTSDAWQPAAELGKWAFFKCYSEGEVSMYSFCRGCLVMCLWTHGDGLLKNHSPGLELEGNFCPGGGQKV